ncbi:MAG: lysophospholipid acyltransferase family protein [Isosphaeraceae bacterium]|nr:lysophospholipid acyltransferase family protein [Isosphaeraceae bacterium]
MAANAQRLGQDWDVRQVSRSLARQTYRWRVRDRLLEGRSDARVRLLFDVRGRDHLDAAVARGKGVILLANHFGSHVMIAHWMLRQGYSARWFGERPRNVSTYLGRQLRSDGPLGQDGLFLSRRGEVSESAARILHAARVLNAGMVLMLASDVRSVDPRAAHVEFLGRVGSFATTWVNLAAITGAAVVPAFCRLDESGIHHLEFHDPYHVPPDARRPGQGQEWVRRALAAVEEHVLAYPEQSNDYFFWGYQGRSSDRLAQVTSGNH